MHLEWYQGQYNPVDWDSFRNMMSLKSTSALLSRVAQSTVPNSSENQCCHLQEEVIIST